MKRLFKILLLSLSFYSLCGTVFTGTQISSQTYFPETKDLDNQYYIATLSLESVDLSDQDTLILLADILSRFEIVALQNIQPETAESALDELIAKINAYGHQYEYIIDSFTAGSKPRFAYIYRTDIVYPVEWYSYSDFWIDDAVQEPFVVRFENNDGDFDFTLINCQVNSELASTGIDLLSLLVNNAKINFPDELDIIILGPTNTKCERTASEEPLQLSSQEDLICLINYDKAKNEINDTSTNPQIIVAAYSDELFWEEGEKMQIEESSAVFNTHVESSVDQPGFTSVIVVKAGEDNNKSQTKGFCFFNSTLI